ncbi:MAG: hypothetical protein KAJ10_13655 [Thermodesulfovibrionia bacterium]|nr:hypothetical protein [Thermodesulfovibrionia bacterium]
MAKIKSNLIRSPLFITLTYHHGHEVDTSIHRDHFHNFLTQLRVLDDNIQYIWRLEYQKRGAPHYHLILFPSLSLRRFPDLWYSGRLTFIWHSISDPDSIAHSKYGFKLTSIKSYQMACSYISKYCGKVDVINEVKTGFKQWGNSRNLPIQVNLRLDVDREKAYNYLEIIRTWLLKQGKAQFESHEFFNISCDQTIFIDYTVSMDLLNELYNMFDTF